MECVRCDMEIKPHEKILMNDNREVAHDNCIGIDDLNENWIECKYISRNENITDYRMYILVNEDIKISKGKLAGQVGHAVMSYLYHSVIKPLQDRKQIESLDDYMKEQKKIILKCPEWRLEELEYDGYLTIRDKGYTQLEPNTLTCINYGIMTPDVLPQWVRELKLYN